MMPGIINQDINPTDKVANYEPEKVTVGEEDTIQGRLPGIINASGPLGEVQTTRAKQAQNTKGTLNSTMSQQAESAALYDFAVPIATHDANTSIDTKYRNQAAGNEASQFNVGSQNSATDQVRQQEQDAARQTQAGEQAVEQIAVQGDEIRATAGAENEFQVERDKILNDYQLERDAILDSKIGDRDQRLADIDAARDLRLQEIEATRDQTTFENQQVLQNLSQEHQTALADLENRWGTLRETTKSASLLMAQFMSGISAVLANPDLDLAARNNAINQQITILNNIMPVIGRLGNVDLTDILGANSAATTPTAPPPIFDSPVG